MSFRALTVGLILASASQATQRVSAGDLPYQAVFELSRAPLTTDTASQLDPDELNPQLARWVLERKVVLKGLQAIPSRGGLFAVRTDGVLATGRGWVRGEGPWFSDINRFPCTAMPKGGFGTRDGAEQAVKAANELWSGIVEKEKLRLALQLEHLSADSSGDALAGAQKIFLLWYAEVQKRYEFRKQEEARKAEWVFYHRLVSSSGLCSHERNTQGIAQGSEALGQTLPLEPVPTGELPLTPLAHAPARRWNGLYSIRVNFRYGDKKLVGQFLIDSGAPKTVFSPDWLVSQGVPPSWIEERQIPLEKLKWSAPPLLNDESHPALVRTAYLGPQEDLDLGGLILPIREVRIAKTGFFDSPEAAAHCCDGVLGEDFLRKYSVEFVPNIPPAPLKSAEITLWPRENYHLPGATWVGVSLNSDSIPTSACRLSSGRGTAFKEIDLHWLTGQPDALRGTVRMGGAPLLSCRTASEALGAVPIRAQALGWDAGMEFLGKEGMVWDLSHGRLWFPRKFLNRPILRNNSGVFLQFDLRKGERVLVVQRLSSALPAQRLLRAGLKPGAVIQLLGQAEPTDLDQWEVDQILSGALGNTLSLQWEQEPGHVKLVSVPLGNL